MVPAVFPKRPALSLTSADRARLENIAPIFGIDFQQTDERTYNLRTLDEGRAARHHCARQCDVPGGDFSVGAGCDAHGFAPFFCGQAD